MKKTIQPTLFLFALFYLCSHLSFAQIDSVGLEAAFNAMDEAKKCYLSNASNPACPILLERAYNLSEKHPYFLEDLLAFLIKVKDYDEARKYAYAKRVDTLPNSLKARHFHFRGFLEIKSGFYQHTAAYQSFRKAYHFELRSRYPTFKLLSQIQNGMGCARLIYGGPNKNGSDDNPHSNWITSDLVSALENFEQALYFDSENKSAKANRDTILSKIKAAGKWDESILEKTRPKPINVIKQELLVEEKFSNDSLDKINYSLLPNNKELLLQILQEYDELLVVADISGSMEDIHEIKGVSRFELMRELVLFLFHRLNPLTKIGISTVGGGCKRPPKMFYHTERNARIDIVNTMKSFRPKGNTPLAYTLNRGKELYSEKENRKALFLISDGMEKCDPPMDLCIIAGDLYALGVDLHIISFIVPGMEDYELAYEIYSCMTEYSQGKIFKYDEDVAEEAIREPNPIHEEELLLPPILIGENLKGVLHFEVDLTEYFKAPFTSAGGRR